MYYILSLFWWSHQGSNLNLEFRKLLFYPLNYETGARPLFEERKVK